MPTFGENLRREREMRGVTLEEISESTKINVRILKALEADQFSELPGGIFTRNFIRAYTQYLGLDEEHALAEYKSAAGSPVDNDLSRLAPNKTLSASTGPRSRFLPWVVAAILLGSGYAVYRYSQRSAEVRLAPQTVSTPPSTAAPPADSTNPAGTTPSTGAASPANSAPAQASGSGSKPATGGAGTAGGQDAPAQQPASQPGSVASPAGTASAAAAPELGEGDLVLQVSASEDAWVAIAADGKTLWQHTLPANSSRTFRARDFFDVTTGNAQGTALTLNGQAQKVLGREGEFKRVHLTRDSSQAKVPPQTPAQQ
jgi:cytoskeleton protein RodZ